MKPSTSVEPAVTFAKVDEPKKSLPPSLPEPSPWTSAPLAADPKLLPKDESQRSVTKTIVKSGSSYTNLATWKYHTTTSVSEGIKQQTLGPWQGRFRLKARAVYFDAAAFPSKYTPHDNPRIVRFVRTGTDTNRWLINPGALWYEQTNKKAGKSSFVEPKEATYVTTLEDGSVVVKALSSGVVKTLVVDKDGSQALPDVDYVVFRLTDSPNPTNEYKVHRENADPIEDIIVLLDANAKGIKEEIELEKGFTSEGSVGYKPIKSDDVIPPLKPTADDIQQLGLGDCYLQAALMSMANTDPGHLTKMMKDNNDGTVTVRFFNVAGKKDSPKDQTFTEEYIRVNKTLPGKASGDPLYNKGAAWARIIQKAFAEYTRKHGQYGDAYEKRKETGYEAIGSGAPSRLYAVFYGKQIQSAASTTVTFDPSKNADTNLRANRDIIEQLARLGDPSTSRTQPGETINLTASATLAEHLKRAGKVAPRAANAIRGLNSGLAGELDTLGPQFEEAAKQKARPENKDKAIAALDWVDYSVKEASELTKPGGPLAKLVEANENHDDLNMLFEILLDLKTAGTDASEGQRFIYSEHAYAVIKADLSPKVDPSKLTMEDVAKINMTSSKVTLRNPHHGNVPNPSGAKDEDKTGLFTLTLAQFLRNFSELESGVVTKTA